ncbi:hypothetical protein RUM44_011623 [Polyplax serrata]|uniref:Uncharacterized protein n=1 Tax=Polyplax serrata TaxID=468196 RepID=A0ABR1ASB6_POLSC
MLNILVNFFQSNCSYAIPFSSPTRGDLRDALIIETDKIGIKSKDQEHRDRESTHQVATTLRWVVQFQDPSLPISTTGNVPNSYPKTGKHIPGTKELKGEVLLTATPIPAQERFVKCFENLKHIHPI